MEIWREAVFGTSPTIPVRIPTVSSVRNFLALSSWGSLWQFDDKLELLDQMGRTTAQNSRPRNMTLTEDCCTELLTDGDVEFVLCVALEGVYRIELPGLEFAFLKYPRNLEDQSISPRGEWVVGVAYEDERVLVRERLNIREFCWESLPRDVEIDETLCGEDAKPEYTGEYMWSVVLVDDDGTGWIHKMWDEGQCDGLRYEETFVWKVGRAPEQVKSPKMTDWPEPMRCFESPSLPGRMFFTFFDDSQQRELVFVPNRDKCELREVTSASTYISRNGSQTDFRFSYECFEELDFWSNSSHLKPIPALFRWRYGRKAPDTAAVSICSRNSVQENGKTTYPLYYSECQIVSARNSLRNLCLAFLISSVDLSPFEERSMHPRLSESEVTGISLFEKLPNDEGCRGVALGFLDWRQKVLLWEKPFLENSSDAQKRVALK